MPDQCLRLAILYSDGSIGVPPGDATRAQADDQKALCDAGETDPAHRCGLAMVNIAVTETLVAVGEG